MMNAKSSRSKLPLLTTLQESWHEFTYLSSVQQVETDISNRRTPSISASRLKGYGNNPSLFTAFEGEQYANLLALMCAVTGYYWGLIFTFLQIPHLCTTRCSNYPNGPPNHSAAISSQWNENYWCYNNITPCHNHLHAYWKGKKCVVLSLSQYCLPLESMMTSSTKSWKDLAA